MKSLAYTLASCHFHMITFVISVVYCTALTIEILKRKILRTMILKTLLKMLSKLRYVAPEIAGVCIMYAGFHFLFQARCSLAPDTSALHPALLLWNACTCQVRSQCSSIDAY